MYLWLSESNVILEETPKVPLIVKGGGSLYTEGPQWRGSLHPIHQ